MDRAHKFRQRLATSLGCDGATIDKAGVTVKGDPERAESHVTAGYLLGDHFVVTCDPAVEELLTDATSGMAPTFDAWTRVAEKVNGEFLGAARMQLLDSLDVSAPPLPEGYQYRTLQKDDDESLGLIAGLISESDEDDLDEAELEIDHLDDILEVIVGPNGAIAAFGSSADFSLAPGYGDIGVLTHHEHRKSQLGSAVVAALGVRQLALGIEPLYRCDEDNTASIRLSKGLGFQPVTQLRAYRFDI